MALGERKTAVERFLHIWQSWHSTASHIHYQILLLLFEQTIVLNSSCWQDDLTVDAAQHW